MPSHKPPSSVSVKAGPRGGGPPEGGAPAGPSGRDLLERVRRREPEALAAFFDLHFDSIYALLYRLLGDWAAAEDAAQDVFLKVHRAAEQLDPARDPRPWLRTIAYNVGRDLWRSGAYRMSRRAASLDDPPETAPVLADGAPDPLHQLLSGERERLVQKAIAELPETLREMVVLHDYEGLAHHEIAELIGVNPAAARKRYSRALAALAARLKDKLR